MKFENGELALCKHVMEDMKLALARVEDLSGAFESTRTRLVENINTISQKLPEAIKPITDELRTLRTSMVWTVCLMFIISTVSIAATLIFVVASQTESNVNYHHDSDGHDFSLSHTNP